MKVMKPFLAFFLLLILLQTLMLGSLVKLEFPEVAQSNLQKSLYQKQVLFDPFLLPDNSIVQKTAQSQNDWLPFNFNDKFTSKKISFLPIINRMSFIPNERQQYSDIPFFILIGSMRV